MIKREYKNKWCSVSWDELLQKGKEKQRQLCPKPFKIYSFVYFLKSDLKIKQKTKVCIGNMWSLDLSWDLIPSSISKLKTILTGYQIYNPMLIPNQKKRKENKIEYYSIRILLIDAQNRGTITCEATIWRETAGDGWNSRRQQKQAPPLLLCMVETLRTASLQWIDSSIQLSAQIRFTREYNYNIRKEIHNYKQELPGVGDVKGREMERNSPCHWTRNDAPSSHVRFARRGSPLSLSLFLSVPVWEFLRHTTPRRACVCLFSFHWFNRRWDS